MQIILVFETRSSCESDYRYVKSAIDYFYGERMCKLTPIFAGSKSKLIKQDKKIMTYSRKYSGNTYVIICADYDLKTEFDNKAIINYCRKNKYEIIWMNIDVEEVFLGHRVSDRLKNKASIDFLRKKNEYLSKIITLEDDNPFLKHPSSNLLIVLDKILKRKT